MSIESYVHGGGAVPVRTRRVFLHTGTAYEGLAVCFNNDAVNVTAENESVASGTRGFHSAIDGWSDARVLMVEAPKEGNMLTFAGVVAKESDGVVGPNWITIHRPGSICRVYSTCIVSSLITGGIGVAAISVAKVLNFCYAIQGNTAAVLTAPRSGAFLGGGFRGEGAAQMLAEGVASLPNDTYLKMARLLEGPPSGGITYLACTSVDMGQASHTSPYVPLHGTCIVMASSAGSAIVTIAAAGPAFAGAALDLINGDVATANSVTLRVSGADVYRYHTSPTATTVVTTGNNVTLAVMGEAVCTGVEKICLRAFGSAWVLHYTNGTAT